MTEALKKTVAPVKGHRVRHPDGSLLDEASEVIFDSYWQRRLNDGDVVLVEHDATEIEKKGK